ncbi:response regulator transcription factor [Synechococcus sp. HK05]|uniref:response regulator transcription factor n=1 Tax=Synechococcus sp. HK05 TaxID=2725975 RepID=UPI001C38544A|nr:response regulator transcription factor [Synechococcus sp. HK05]MBV2351516.1 response regulator transcription factor [Synechococcus sp. HK05]
MASVSAGGQNTSVLLADDDPRLRQFLELELEEEGYAVRSFSDGIGALTEIRQQPPDLVILDWMLPDLSGVEVCQRLRSTGLLLPVLMLTGRDAVADRVQALDAGADDYLVKPFSIEELLARLRALARRSPAAGGGQTQSEVLQLEDLQLDLASHEVSRGGVPVQLSRTEFQLLQCLMAGAGRVQSRESLLERVWGESFVGDANVLDVYVRYLRRKLEPPGQPTLIQTVRGVGFLLKAGAIKEPAA